MAKEIAKGAGIGAAAGLFAGNRAAAETAMTWAKNYASTGRITNSDGTTSLGKVIDAAHPYVNEAGLQAAQIAQHVGGAALGAIAGGIIAHRIIKNRNLGRQFGK